MPISVGIDLGTTYSAVAVIDQETNLPKIVPNREGKNITPSVIQFINGKTVFGSDAQSAFNAGVEGCAATFKRHMGKNDTYCIIDGISYTSEKLSELLLGHLKEEAESVLNDKILDAVITVPAYFYSPEREATISAAEKAGIKVKKIIDEPNAAAMAYGLKYWRENANILVYDLGGGTFDVTLTHMIRDGELNTITTRGDHCLGGRDWDDRIESILLDKFASETGLDTHNDKEIKNIIRGLSEEVKRRLSTQNNYNVTVTLPAHGKAAVTITREEFESRSIDLIDRTGSLCKAVLAEAGISERDVTDVLLVGGSTRMPQVSDYITKIFGKKPISPVNPDEAVAIGAAIQTTKENESYSKLAIQIQNGKKVTDRKTSGVTSGGVLPVKKLSGVGVLTLRETTAHAMGIIAVSTDSSRYINDIIIPANHPRPVRVAKAFTFHTAAADENEMDVYVLQGDKENPLDNLISYRYVISGIKHIKEKGANKLSGVTKIRVQYSYDNNGVIHVEARQEKENVNLPIRKEQVPEDMSKYALPIDQKELYKQQPLFVVMAVDVSGSMSDRPLSDAQDAMCKFVHDLDFSYTQAGIVAVSDSSAIVCNLSNDEKKCINAIRSIKCGQTGFGNDAHPFDTIKTMLKGKEGRLFAIILADGVWSNQYKAVSAAKQCNSLNIETAAIGFGGADQKFLKDISSEDANALFVSQSELSSAFGTIAQSLSSESKADLVCASDTDTWEN